MGKRTRKPRGAGSGQPAPGPARVDPARAAAGIGSAAPPPAGVPGTPDGPPVAPPREDRNAAMKRGYARGEARNEAIRQSLEPLKPGERPGAVTAAALVAAGLGVLNIVLWAVGVDTASSDDEESNAVLATFSFAAVMFVAAYFMWKARYWAVIGFQALLGITIVIAGLSLPLASNLAAVAICVTVLLLGGTLFWKLVRALARLQMPAR